MLRLISASAKISFSRRGAQSLSAAFSNSLPRFFPDCPITTCQIRDHSFIMGRAHRQSSQILHKRCEQTVTTAMRRRQSRLIHDTWSAESRRERQKRRATPQNVALSWAAFLLSVLLVIGPWLPFSRTSAGVRPPGPKLHLFTAPKQFTGPDGAHQRRALQTWLQLRPRPRVTLLGSGFADIAQEFGVSARPVDETFLGVPLFHAVLAAANSSTPPAGEVVVLLNADILLFDDFPLALAKLRENARPPWVALGARWDIEELPFEPENAMTRQALVRFVRAMGTLHTYGGIDVWAWPAGTLPPLRVRTPPFVFGRGKYDNWFTHELLSARRAAIVDVSEACTIAHVKHDYHLVQTSRTTLPSKALEPGAFWSSDPAEKFELYINAHHAASHGSFMAQYGTILHAPYKLAACHAPTAPTLCLLHRRRPHACRCEHSPFVSSAQSDPFVVEGSRVIFCGLRSADAVAGYGPRAVAARWPISGRAKANMSSPAVFGLPLTLPDLLGVIANRTKGGTALLVVAARSDKRLLANTVCSARATGVFPRMIVAGLDDDLYTFALLQGFPVYLDGTVVQSEDEARILEDANHEDPAFRAMRELAAMRVIAQLVALGINVVHVSPGAVLQRNVVAYFLQEVETDVDVAFAVALFQASGRKLSTAGLFVRSNAKSLAFLNQALWLTLQSHHAINKALENLACGVFGVSGTSGRICQVGGAIGVKAKFLDSTDVEFLSESQLRGESIWQQGLGRPSILLPDERETPEGKLTLLAARGYIKYNDQLGTCWT